MGRISLSDDDKRAAVLELLESLGRGDDLEVIVESARLRHPKNDTFPGEVFLDVARDALDLAGATRLQPIAYDGLRDALLVEWPLRGKEKARFQHAVLAAAAGRGGIEPDLLDEVIWSHGDDFWFYGTLAAVACIRAAAEARDKPVAAVCDELSRRRSTP